MEESNLINEHALNREPVPLSRKVAKQVQDEALFSVNAFALYPSRKRHLIGVYMSR